jgi:hypothetical protein
MRSIHRKRAPLIERKQWRVFAPLVSSMLRLGKETGTQNERMTRYLAESSESG